MRKLILPPPTILSGGLTIMPEPTLQQMSNQFLALATAEEELNLAALLDVLVSKLNQYQEAPSIKKSKEIFALIDQFRSVFAEIATNDYLNEYKQNKLDPLSQVDTTGQVVIKRKKEL